MSDSLTTIPVAVDPEALRRAARERALLRRAGRQSLGKGLLGTPVPAADDRPTVPVLDAAGEV